MFSTLPKTIFFVVFDVFVTVKTDLRKTIDQNSQEKSSFVGPSDQPLQGIAFVVFDSAMAARRACGLSGEMFKAGKGGEALGFSGRKIQKLSVLFDVLLEKT